MINNVETYIVSKKRLGETWGRMLKLKNGSFWRFFLLVPVFGSGFSAGFCVERENCSCIERIDPGEDVGAKKK